MFCSRCGTRLITARPGRRNEFAVDRIYPSLWRFAGHLVLAVLPLAGAAYVLLYQRQHLRYVPLLVLVSCLLFGLVLLARRATNWSVTSERLIQREGIFSTRRREVELADIRSVEVSQRFSQKLLGLGDVVVASAASADYLIRLLDVSNPDAIADVLRKARLRRLA